MNREERAKWDSRYRDNADMVPAPAMVLVEYAHLLPVNGKALDLAAGLGGNALFLAHHGLDTSAWDISAVAMEALSLEAERNSVVIDCQVRDVVAEPPVAESFDVIVVSRFLERALSPAISAALCPGGLLFYQTFVAEKTDSTLGPFNPDFLLQQNEMLRLFPGLTVRAYRDEGLLGDTAKGLRNEAYLVAEKI